MACWHVTGRDLTGVYGIFGLHLPLGGEEPGGLWQASLTLTSPLEASGELCVLSSPSLGTSFQTPPHTLSMCHFSHFIIPQFPDLRDQHAPPHLLAPCSQHALLQTGLWADRQHVCRFSTAILVHSGCEFSPKAHLPGFRSPGACEKGMEWGCWIEPSGNSEYLVGRTSCEKAKLPVSYREPWKVLFLEESGVVSVLRADEDKQT